MLLRLRAKLDKSSFICLVALACIAILIIPAGCIDIKFSGNKGPYTYKTNDEVSISWYLDYYPSKLESYEIFVSLIEDNNEKKTWSDRVVLNDASEGENSPIDRSINLGKMAEGSYFAAFASKPNDNFPAINDHSIFVVAPTTGFINISNFYDSNGDGRKDIGEGINGTNFQMTGPQRVVFNASTGPDGTATKEVPIGKYTIIESPRDCWRSLTGMIPVVNVLEDQTASVIFMDEPDTQYEIFGYNNSTSTSTHDGLSGFTFVVSGPDGTQTLVSGSDGIARPPRPSLPGTYTVIATPPTGMEMATPSQIEFDPCVQKRLEFGANKTRSPLSAITGRMTQLGKWIFIHDTEIGLIIFVLCSLAIILYIFSKKWAKVARFIGDILKYILESVVVTYIITKMKFIFDFLWIFIQTPFGFIFSITYGFLLSAIEINSPGFIRPILTQIPEYIVIGIISWVVAKMLVPIYNHVNPMKISHSMAYYITDGYACSYLNLPKLMENAKIKWVWYSPDNKSYESDSLEIKSGNRILCSCTLQIGGENTANLLGVWRVDVFINGNKLLSDKFVVLNEKDLDETHIPGPRSLL